MRITRDLQGDARSALFDRGEIHVATVFFDDLVHDREAEPSALFAGCHVRLGDPVPLGWQANAVIGNPDFDEFVALFDRYRNPPGKIGTFVRRTGLHRLDRMFAAAIGQRLTYKELIA